MNSVFVLSQRERIAQTDRSGTLKLLGLNPLGRQLSQLRSVRQLLDVISEVVLVIPMGIVIAGDARDQLVRQVRAINNAANRLDRVLVRGFS